MSQITDFLVREDGIVNEEKSVEKFRSAMLKHIAESETELATIATAVGAVFDQYKGASINMPALCNFALGRLNAQPENYKSLSDRVAQYVRDNAQGKDLTPKGQKEKVWENSSSLFVISKGVGGGVCRRADRPVKPETTESK